MSLLARYAFKLHLVNMRLAQDNGEEKYKRAIRVWKEDLAYIRNI